MSNDNNTVHNKQHRHYLFCVMGRSASGKSSLIRDYCNKHKDYSFIQSYTTRPAREDDISADKPDHIFISEDDVKKYIKDMAAYTEINGHKYFTTNDQLFKNDFYTIDPIGFEWLCEYVVKNDLDIVLIPIYITVSKENLQDRAVKRGQSIESYNKRYDDENSQFAEYENNSMFYMTNYVINGNVPFDKLSEWFTNLIDSVIEEDFDE